jgi:hypothetical protein
LRRDPRRNYLLTKKQIFPRINFLLRAFAIRGRAEFVIDGATRDDKIRLGFRKFIPPNYQ